MRGQERRSGRCTLRLSLSEENNPRDWQKSVN